MPLSLSPEARDYPGLLAPKPLWTRITTLCLDLLFPPRCAGCGRIDTFWCSHCEDELNDTPLPSHVQPLPMLTGIASTALHAGIIREAVQALKYENARLLAEPLGERMSRQFERQNWNIDLITAVPLHATRLEERGYNQAQLLGEALARRTTLPCIPSALRRERNTQSQVTMTAEERLTNVQDAFVADPEWVANRSVLLIDDVYTTGATLSACAQALLDADAQAVYGLTVTAARI